MKYKKHICTPKFLSFSTNSGEKAFDTVEVDKSPTLATASTSDLAKQAHAHSGMWVRLIREFPCDGQGCVGVWGVPCLYQESSEECSYRVLIRSSMVWMRDSGAFTRQGTPRLHQQLFERNEEAIKQISEQRWPASKKKQRRTRPALSG